MATLYLSQTSAFWDPEKVMVMWPWKRKEKQALACVALWLRLTSVAALVAQTLPCAFFPSLFPFLSHLVLSG